MGRFLASALAVLAVSLIVGAPGSAHGYVVFVPAYLRPVVPEPKTADVSAIKTVAVISAFCQTYQLQHVGFWGTKSKTEDIAAWNLDDFAVGTVRKLLSARFAFKDLAYDRLTLARVPNGPMDNSTSALKKYLSQLPNDGLDAFIVLRPDLESHGGAQGLAHGSGQTLTATTADYEIDIVDAHALAILAKSYSRVRTRADGAAGFAVLYLGNDMRVEEDLAFTDAQRSRLREEFTRLIDLSVLETLRSLSLGAELPAPASLAEVPAGAQ